MTLVKIISVAAAISLISVCATTGTAQTTAAKPDTAASANEAPLQFLYGEWVGTAKGMSPNGQPYEITQTERVGPMLDGAVTVIEGRGYSANGKVAFNAFAVASQDKRTGKWEMRSYAGGYVGTYSFEPSENGFVWTIPAGPGAVTRFTATVIGDDWTQIGEYVPAEGPPRKTFEMTLRRIGDTNWPSAGYVKPPEGEAAK
ncbi:MAG: DUF1579 domain-containing protein [Sphingorhabdus sp.]